MKKEKKAKVKKTAKQKLASFLKAIVGIILAIAVIACAVNFVNLAMIKQNSDFVTSKIQPVKYTHQLVPSVDDKGNYEFVTDGFFRIMHLTDVHLGGGFLSTEKDTMALNAVAAMITAEKPDLVVVTGDVAFPVPYVAGTFNNKRPAILFADLMEKLGVYWCIAYGNHDTEAYSFYSREQISGVYGNHDKYPHSLFQKGPDDVDGYGNYVINVKNSKGKILQSLFMIDSHSYTDHDYFGIMWKYDCIHKSQIDWYKEQVRSLTQQNGGETPKSLMFFHIPLIEMRDAYNEYKNNGFKDTENVQYVTGEMGEKDITVYSSEKNEGMFDACVSMKSTHGIFFGHDHLNNMSLFYKDIIMSYGYSIDYLAYSDIETYGAQRGCQMITVTPLGGYRIKKENYYQNKYTSVLAKEDVTMDAYYKDAE